MNEDEDQEVDCSVGQPPDSRQRVERDHRYLLRREWIGSGGILNWIMLNPSTADETFDDPTIRKCCGFAKRWGFRGIVVTNLFAFRATDPKDLHDLIRRGHMDIAIGRQNDEVIADVANDADLVAVAWGANADRYRDRVLDVLANFLRPSCIAVTKAGHPIHPLMAKYTDNPRIYEAPELNGSRLSGARRGEYAPPQAKQDLGA